MNLTDFKLVLLAAAFSVALNLVGLFTHLGNKEPWIKLADPTRKFKSTSILLGMVSMSYLNLIAIWGLVVLFGKQFGQFANTNAQYGLVLLVLFSVSVVRTSICFKKYGIAK